MVLFALLACNVNAFQFYGYAYNVTKGPVNNTNVSLMAYDMSQMNGPPTPVYINWTMTNASGFFNLSMPNNDSWNYKLGHSFGSPCFFLAASLVGGDFYYLFLFLLFVKNFLFFFAPSCRLL